MQTRDIALALAAAFFASGLFCGGPSDPGSSGNCEEDPATDPASANTGNLPVTLGKTRSEQYAPTGDASIDTDAPPGDYYTIFEPLADEDATLDIVYGFQGGSHIEPAVALPAERYDTIDSVVRFQLRNPENGDVMTTKSCQQTGRDGWDERQDRLVFDSLRLVLEDGASSVLDKQMELIADIEINGDRKVLKQMVTVVAGES
jgi:hypothetical protein